MTVIPRELRKPNTNSAFHRALRESLFLSDIQKKLLLGSLMGDGCLIVNSSGTNYRLQVEHCAKQKDYVVWKYNVFKNFVLSKPAYQPRTCSWKFRTLSHIQFSEYHDMFYTQGRKILPENLDFLEDPLVCAVWFMDDGGKLGNGCLLNIQNFTDAEAYRLRVFFHEKFKISATLQRNKGHFRLYIPKHKRFLWDNFLGGNLREEFRYKIS